MADAEARAAAPIPSDLSDEVYREYEFDSQNGRHVYRIMNPKGLVVGTTTHRVLDSNGVVHCVPNVGHRGCVLRWKVKDGAAPIRF